MMPTPFPTILDKGSNNGVKAMPIGWEGAKFPLSKLDLSKLARDYGKKGRSSLKNSIITVNASGRGRLPHVPAAARVVARRQKGVASPRSSGGNSPRISPRVSAGNVRLVSRTDNGWSWLSVKFKEIRANKFVKPRKGELPTELIKAIWGSHNLRQCQLAGDSLKGFGKKKISIDPELEIKKIRAKRQDQSGQRKSADSLMDILLHNWTYFEHSHSTLGKTDKQVHAKYCENEFGHFLLSDGQQIHGQFHVNLNVLIKELRNLLKKLRSQILPMAYQELPSWKSPRLEEDPELEIPPMPPMPQLYPISGLAPIPSEQEENIPNDYPAPVFKSPIPREHPPLVLPESLKVPPLKLPVMPIFAEDESTVDYDTYKEEPLPVLVLPPQEPLPVWEEPHLAEPPPEPEYLLPQVIPPPVLESMPPFRPPLLDPRPCEKSYYELGKDERGICDGLCSKHGYKHHFIPGQHRREPCFAKPPQLLSLPPPPFPEAESVLLRSEFQNINQSQNLAELQIIPEPMFEAPLEEPIPPFETPTFKEDPVFVQPPPAYLPTWKEPTPPPPLGWMGGQRPVFLIDCSGAMIGERMEAVQECLRSLFSPGGQVKAHAKYFFLLADCGTDFRNDEPVFSNSVGL